MLEYDCLLLGWPIFRGEIAVSGSVIYRYRFLTFAILQLHSGLSKWEVMKGNVSKGILRGEVAWHGSTVQRNP